ncbi:MAG: polysaccharide pyruvyl transferase family protein [Pseudonocardiaceae bacterium]
MISRGLAKNRRRSTGTAPRVGFFGLLGSGNVGNDGSFESMLAFLRDKHPDAELGALCGGPEQVRARYGIPATPMRWYQRYEQTPSGRMAAAWKAVGRILDTFRTVWWVRRFDVVIVPGAGILEATLPVRPWGLPYGLFLLSASGRLCGTKVALVSVGADVVQEPVTRWLITRAARLAHYRSYRDTHSKDAMRKMGVDTSGDEVYPDLAFGLQIPPDVSVESGTVGVGVMAYFGGNFDRQRADEIYASYVDKMKLFVRWLVDSDRHVRLLIGDNVDQSVVREIVSDLRTHRPDLDHSRVGAEPVSSFADLMQQMKSVDTVVATRYHNVLCALKLSKPTVSIGYAVKNEALMAESGLVDFCQTVTSLDVERLIEQFIALESRRELLHRSMVEKNRAAARRLEHQFGYLSSTLFPVAEPAPVPAEKPGIRS